MNDNAPQPAPGARSRSGPGRRRLPLACPKTHYTSVIWMQSVKKEKKETKVVVRE